MQEFVFEAEVTISVRARVRAATEEEARAMVEEWSLTRIKEIGPDTDVWRTSGELDGALKNIRLAEK